MINLKKTKAAIKFKKSKTVQFYLADFVCRGYKKICFGGMSVKRGGGKVVFDPFPMK